MQNLDLDLEIYDIWYENLFSKSFYILTFILLVLIIIIFIKKIKNNNYKNGITNDDIIININKLKIKINDDSNIEFYIELIRILKQFIYLNYNKNFTTKTEDELLDFLKNQNLDKDFNENLRRIMNNSLNAKFGKVYNTKLQMEEDLRGIIDLIGIIIDSINNTKNKLTT